MGWPQLRHGRLAGRAWMRSDAPARDRRDRLRALLLRQLLGAPAPQQEAGNAGLLRRQLQAARGVERENADLRHHCRQGPAAQGFLQRPAHLRIAPRGHQDQPAQVEPEGGKAGGVKVVLLRHPDDPPGRCAGLQGQGEETRAHRTLFFIAGLPGNLMHGAARNGGGAQVAIDRGQAGGQRLASDARLRPQRRDRGDALSELGQVDPSIHCRQSIVCSLFVLNRTDCQAAAQAGNLRKSGLNS